MVALAMPFFSLVLQNQISEMPARLVGLMKSF
jgi:hypothetical protein